MSTYDLLTLTTLLDASPTARHVVHEARILLESHGFSGWSGEGSPNTAQLSRGYLARAGSIIAWSGLSEATRHQLRIVGAHTDSPGLTLKPGPSTSGSGFGLLNVEVYGGPLLNSWLDRDLHLAGVVVTKRDESMLFRSSSPVARLSQLAIHLDREVNDKGLVLDRHTHLRPTWTTSDSSDARDLIASLAGVRLDEIETWDCRLADAQPARVIGDDSSMLASARLDNQLSCWASLHALLSANGPSVVALFDHEEIGSQTSVGAESSFFSNMLERLFAAAGASRAQFLEALANGHCISSDNAHAVHPNYPERHDQHNAPLFNRGIAVKWNTNQRYATTPEAIRPVIAAAEASGQTLQHFSSKNTMPCGSTIGPITASILGMETVDIGVPQLSMHSAREVCGVDDALRLEQLLAAYFARR
ncbi:MAG: M18 family aminopeptidase [Ilumatobacteraceae bacterium]